MAARLRLILGLLAVVLSGFVVGSAIDALRLPGTDIALSPTVRDALADHASPSVGPVRAPVTVLIFTDYRCAVCRRDHDDVARVIASRPDVRFVFKEWAVLGSVSREAARIALAAAHQGRYLRVRDQLMRSATVEGDWPRLRRDLARHRGDIDAELARTGRQAFALGLPGTPAYLIERRLVIGGLSERQLRRLIERAANGG